MSYNMPFSNLPSQRACGDHFSVGHVLSCKKGGFVAQRHGDIRDLSINIATQSDLQICGSRATSSITE